VLIPLPSFSFQWATSFGPSWAGAAPANSIEAPISSALAARRIPNTSCIVISLSLGTEVKMPRMGFDSRFIPWTQSPRECSRKNELSLNYTPSCPML